MNLNFLGGKLASMNASLIVLLNAAISISDLQSQGAKLESERRWADAAALYTNTLKNPSLAPTVKFWLQMSSSEMAFHQGNYRQAKLHLNQAEQTLQLDSSQPDSWIRLWNAKASLLLVEGKLTAAANELTRAANLAETSPDKTALPALFHNLASLRAQCGDLKAAEELENKSITAWTKQFGEQSEYLRRAWISLSSIQALQKRWLEAHESLLKSLSIGESPEALANDAIVLDKLKRGREANALRARIPAIRTLDTSIDLKSLLAGRQSNSLMVR